ncbi:hypothetical protein DFH09DRAFT_1094059 [Mycena vulgaris]|nr:hypothetical protein DFH09DRAFT_1094059 [Mycena vulgaris]
MDEHAQIRRTVHRPQNALDSESKRKPFPQVNTTSRGIRLGAPLFSDIGAVLTVYTQLPRWGVSAHICRVHAVMKFNFDTGFLERFVSKLAGGGISGFCEKHVSESALSVADALRGFCATPGTTIPIVRRSHLRTCELSLNGRDTLTDHRDHRINQPLNAPVLRYFYRAILAALTALGGAGSFLQAHAFESPTLPPESAQRILHLDSARHNSAHSFEPAVDILHRRSLNAYCGLERLLRASTPIPSGSAYCEVEPLHPDLPDHRSVGDHSADGEDGNGAITASSIGAASIPDWQVEQQGHFTLPVPHRAALARPFFPNALYSAMHAALCPTPVLALLRDMHLCSHDAHYASQILPIAFAHSTPGMGRLRGFLWIGAPLTVHQGDEKARTALAACGTRWHAIDRRRSADLYYISAKQKLGYTYDVLHADDLGKWGKHLWPLSIFLPGQGGRPKRYSYRVYG